MAVHYSPLKAERDAQRRAKAAEKKRKSDEGSQRRKTLGKEPERQRDGSGVAPSIWSVGATVDREPRAERVENRSLTSEQAYKKERLKERERKRAEKIRKVKKVKKERERKEKRKQARARQIIDARDALTSELGRPPSLPEIGRRVGVTGERVRQLLNQAGEPTGEFRRHATLTRSHRVASEREQRERRRSIERDILAARNVEIMEARRQGITYREIAEQHGLHLQTVQQIVGKMKRELAVVLAEAAA